MDLHSITQQSETVAKNDIVLLSLSLYIHTSACMYGECIVHWPYIVCNVHLWQAI
jgi:hypothetical protein